MKTCLRTFNPVSGLKSVGRHGLAAAALLAFGLVPLQAKDLTDSYAWAPIAIGAGGWADGMIVSETDPNVRSVRADTGQAYRWDVAANRWLPMIVQNDDGSRIRQGDHSRSFLQDVCPF